MAKKQTEAQRKVHLTMKHFKEHKLHSGSKKGPMVRSRAQAVAIAMNASGQSRKRKR